MIRGLKPYANGFVVGRVMKDWKPGKPLILAEEEEIATDPYELLPFFDPQERPRQQVDWGYPSRYLIEVERDMYYGTHHEQ